MLLQLAHPQIKSKLVWYIMHKFLAPGRLICVGPHYWILLTSPIRHLGYWGGSYPWFHASAAMYALFWDITQQSGNSVLKIRHNLSVSSSSVKKPKILDPWRWERYAVPKRRQRRLLVFLVGGNLWTPRSNTANLQGSGRDVTEDPALHEWTYTEWHDVIWHRLPVVEYRVSSGLFATL